MALMESDGTTAPERFTALRICYSRLVQWDRSELLLFCERLSLRWAETECAEIRRALWPLRMLGYVQS